MDLEIPFQDQFGEMMPMSFGQMTPSQSARESNITMETEETAPSLIASPKSHYMSKISSSPLCPDNYSKDSLKFARRIARSFLQLIQDGPNRIIQDFFETGIKVLESQVSLLDVEIIYKEKLIKTWFQAINDVWRFFSKTLSCSYNKKISKVTKEVWDMVFTEGGFWKAFKDSGNSLQFKDCFTGNGPSEIAVAESLCKKVLFVVNRGLILSHLFSMRQQVDIFYENIKTADNYLVLGMMPELYDCYNHKRGVFIDQCCKSCKVCLSRSADKSVLYKIATAWDNAIAFQNTFASNWSSQSFEDPYYPLNILQFLTILDTPVIL